MRSRHRNHRQCILHLSPFCRNIFCLGKDQTHTVGRKGTNHRRKWRRRAWYSSFLQSWSWLWSLSWSTWSGTLALQGHNLSRQSMLSPFCLLA